MINQQTQRPALSFLFLCFVVVVTLCVGYYDFFRLDLLPCFSVVLAVLYGIFWFEQRPRSSTALILTAFPLTYTSIVWVNYEWRKGWLFCSNHPLIFLLILSACALVSLVLLFALFQPPREKVHLAFAALAVAISLAEVSSGLLLRIFAFKYERIVQVVLLAVFVALSVAFTKFFPRAFPPVAYSLIGAFSLILVMHYEHRESLVRQKSSLFVHVQDLMMQDCNAKTALAIEHTRKESEFIASIKPELRIRGQKRLQSSIQALLFGISPTDAASDSAVLEKFKQNYTFLFPTRPFFHWQYAVFLCILLAAFCCLLYRHAGTVEDDVEQSTGTQM